MPRLRVKVPVDVDVEVSEETLEAAGAVARLVGVLRSSGIVEAGREVVTTVSRAHRRARRRRR